MSNDKKIKRRDIDADDVVGATAENIDGGAVPEVVSDSVTDDYGKFNSLQELLSAYNALQSEFTKRCQLIKQLQAQLDGADAQAQAGATVERETGAERAEQTPPTSPTEAPLEPTVARSSACDREARIAEAIAVIAENIDDCADYLASLPQIADAVILTYKKKLIGASACASPRGMAVVMPAKRPKTLEDAKRLADEMLKSGR